MIYLFDKLELVGARPLHLAAARPFCHLKAPLGLSLFRFAPQTRSCQDRNTIFVSYANGKGFFRNHSIYHSRIFTTQSLPPRWKLSMISAPTCFPNTMLHIAFSCPSVQLHSIGLFTSDDIGQVHFSFP